MSNLMIYFATIVDCSMYSKFHTSPHPQINMDNSESTITIPTHDQMPIRTQAETDEDIDDADLRTIMTPIKVDHTFAESPNMQAVLLLDITDHSITVNDDVANLVASIAPSIRAISPAREVKSTSATPEIEIPVDVTPLAPTIISMEKTIPAPAKPPDIQPQPVVEKPRPSSKQNLTKSPSAESLKLTVDKTRQRMNEANVKPENRPTLDHPFTRVQLNQLKEAYKKHMTEKHAFDHVPYIAPNQFGKKVPTNEQEEIEHCVMVSVLADGEKFAAKTPPSSISNPPPKQDNEKTETKAKPSQRSKRKAAKEEEISKQNAKSNRSSRKSRKHSQQRRKSNIDGGSSSSSSSHRKSKSSRSARKSKKVKPKTKNETNDQ